MEPGLKYRFDDFEADLRTEELRRNGTRLKLQMQPFQVLLALLERPREIVAREELRQRLWPEDTFVDFDHGLNTAMAKLRDVLGDSAAKPKYIETIAKRGYRFMGEVSAVQHPPKITAPAAAPDSLPKAGGPAPSTEAPTAKAPMAKGLETQGLEAKEPATPKEQSSNAEAEPGLPRASRGTARILFMLAQIMYLCFYLSALLNLDLLYQAAYSAWAGAGPVTFVVYLVTALVGVAVRLYLMTATAFDYHLLEEKYRILFPALFALDLLWALSPLLLANRMGLGLALGAIAALIYVPFAQRVLVKMMRRK